MAKKILRISLFLVFAFISGELAFKLKFYNDKNFYPANSKNPSHILEQRFNNLDLKKSSRPNLFLIGDSFLDNDFKDSTNNYEFYFKNWSLKNSHNFINLSLAGTDISDHFSIISKLPDDERNIYLLSIKVHDLEKEIFNKSSSSYVRNLNYSSKLIQLLSKSDLIYLVKDIFHQVNMKINGEPFYGTHLRKVMINTDLNRLIKLAEALKLFSEKKGSKYILVNYPFNFTYDYDLLKQWESFNFFNNGPRDIKIYQSPLIINNKESVDWRNAHPNEVAVRELFDFIIGEIEKNSIN